MPSIVESGPLVTRLIISGLRPDTTGAPALDRNEEGETKDRASWPSAQDDVQQSDIRALNGPWILQEPLNRVCKSPGGAQEIEQARCKIELRCLDVISPRHAIPYDINLHYAERTAFFS